MKALAEQDHYTLVVSGLDRAQALGSVGVVETTGDNVLTETNESISYPKHPNQREQNAERQKQ